MALKTDEIRRLAEERLAELDQERKQLLKVLSALDGGGSPKRSHTSRRSKSTRSSGRRRRKGGTRAEHAEKAVAENPGIKASQIAEELKIKPNYVYRVMGDLLKEGRVTKKGMGYYPAETKEEAPAEAEAAAA